MELWNACIFILVYIVLNVRDGTDSKYPSIVFLSIYEASGKKNDDNNNNNNNDVYMV